VPVETRRFLGRGVSFPFRFGSAGGLTEAGGVTDSEAVQHVKESIQQILGVILGSRVMRRDFGSGLMGALFEPNDPRLDAWLDLTCRQSIQKWEPRVTVGPLYVDRSEKASGRLLLHIEFRIIRTNVVGNLVWPYYLDPSQRQSIIETGIPTESAFTSQQG